MAITQIEHAILGEGVAYPLTFAPENGAMASSVVTSVTTERVNQAIAQLLGTRFYERVNRPLFGSKLDTLLFEPLDDITRQVIRSFIIDAVEKWEKRIRLTYCEFYVDKVLSDWTLWDKLAKPDMIAKLETIDRNTEIFSINYELIETQQPGNCVYPFYTDDDKRIMGFGYTWK